MNSTSVFGIRAWIVAGAGNATVFSANFGTFKLCSAKLVLFNPLVIKITVEGGKSMRSSCSCILLSCFTKKS